MSSHFRFTRLVFAALSLFLLAGGLPAQPKTALASTSWTAAFARAAGADSVVVLAPVELKHPPEYELKPSDLAAVRNAAVVVYAGYEKFAKKLAETAGASGLLTLRIQTTNAPETIKAEARKIADALGTREKFEEWVPAFDALAAETRLRVLEAYPDRRAVVHKMQRPFAETLGLDIVGEFGPAEPSPSLVLELVRKKPALVLDNYHNPSGFPVAESTGAAYAQLINFPGKDGTRSIEDVYAYNAAALEKAAAGAPGRAAGAR
jgi:hypothetical protein